MRRGLTALIAGLVLLVTASACAGDPTTNPLSSGSSTSDAATPDLGDARDALLSRAQLPRLFGQVTTLTAEDVAGEAGDDALLDQLDEDGFVGAVRRDLRGRSRDIAGADSRVLVFSEPAGAQAFLTAVADDPDPFFGGPAEVKPLEVAGAEGVLIKPPMCACAGAQPVYVGLVTAGSWLLWLQITGARASAADVRELLTDRVEALR